MLLPATSCLRARVARHIDRRTSQGDTRSPTSHTISDLSSRTRGSTIEGLDGRREIMRLRLET